MFNRKMWLVALGMALFLTASCGKKSPNAPETSIPYPDQKTLAEGSVSKYKQYLENRSPQEARSLLVNDLKSASGVENAGVSGDGITVWWQLTNGVQYCLFTETRASLTDTTNQGYPMERVEESKANLQIFGLPHNRNALVLSPYQWDWNLLGLIPLQDETSFIDNLLSNTGYNTTFKVNAQKDDQNISLEDYKNFDDYGVIAISSHGGVNSKSEVIIGTGVIATEALYNQYLADLTAGNLNLVVYIDKWFTDDDITAFAFTPKWIAKHYSNKLDSTMFYASVCKGLFNNSMANSITGEGSTYFSWDQSVDTRQATKTGKDLFTQLVSNALNSGEASQKLVDNGNAVYEPPLLSSEPTAYFLYSGDLELRLVEEPLRIGVTPAFWDDIGALLNSFGYEVTTIQVGDLLKNSTFSSYDIIGINCAAGLGSYANQAAANLRNFVSAGGKLYASDYAYVFVEAAFPQYIDFPSNPYIGEGQTLTANIVDQNLAGYLGVTQEEITYDLSAWVVINGVDASANVLLIGDPLTGIAQNKLSRIGHDAILKSSNSIATPRPLAASFSYGSGKVVYTTFHNEAQLSEPVRHILEYFTILEK